MLEIGDIYICKETKREIRITNIEDEIRYGPGMWFQYYQYRYTDKSDNRNDNCYEENTDEYLQFVMKFKFIKNNNIELDGIFELFEN